MALLASQQIVPTGTVRTLVAASGGGDSFTPVPGQTIAFKNGSGAAITVTIATYKTDYPAGVTDAGLVRSVAPGPEVEIRIPDDGVSRFTNPANGLGSITYSTATSLTVGVFVK